MASIRRKQMSGSSQGRGGNTQQEPTTNGKVNTTEVLVETASRRMRSQQQSYSATGTDYMTRGDLTVFDSRSRNSRGRGDITDITQKESWLQRLHTKSQMIKETEQNREAPVNCQTTPDQDCTTESNEINRLLEEALRSTNDQELHKE